MFVAHDLGGIVVKDVRGSLCARWTGLGFADSRIIRLW